TAGTYSNEAKIEVACFDAATQTLIEPHIRYVVFIQNGKIFKSNLVKGGPGPTPVQVSSESAAADLCLFNAKQLADPVTPENTAIVYDKRGPDGACGTADDEWRMVRLSMTSTEAPVSAKQPVTGLIGSTGIPIGWLGFDGNQLTRYDVNFQSPTVLIVNSDPNVQEISRRVGGVDKAVIRVNNSLRVYDGSTGLFPATSSLSLLDCSVDPCVPTSITATGRDASGVYAAVAGTSATNIYRVPLDGSIAVQLATETNPVSVVRPSTNRVIYNQLTANLITGIQQQIKSVPKAGGNAVVLPILGLFGAGGTPVVAGTKVYYNIQSSNAAPIAGIVNEDGSGSTEVSAARWLGIVFSDAFPNLSSITAASRLIRAEGIGFTASPTPSVPATLNYAGATLKSFDPLTGSQIAQLGQVPPTSSPNFFSFDTNKGFSLGQATKTNGSGFIADIYIADPDVASSLARLTTNIN
ncbi:MAG: hypothetical protein H0U63_03915, partial [Burkholderiales bacterium]|nr:hypothetical protein [Burkholderiales bacterium]